MTAVKSALVTGANSGVGFALCERLLDEYPDIKLCLVCRNKTRGEAAMSKLLQSYPGSSVTLVLGDVGSLASVKKCAAQVLELFNHIDFLFLNAGIMTNPSIKWNVVIATFFQPTKLVHRFSTGADLLKIQDGDTEEGFKATFATNVLGHFYMVKQLDSILGGSEPSRIVWTSSKTSSPDAFSIADIQCTSGEDAYASSKYLIDSISVAMNDKLRKQNVTTASMCPGFMISGVSLGMIPMWLWYIIYPIILLNVTTATMCPGAMISGVTLGMVPMWFWYSISPIILMMRVIVPAFTWDPFNGAEALVWLTKQKAEKLDPYHKYYSMCSVMGKPYTHIHKMDNIKLEEADQCYQALEKIINDFKL